MNKRLVLSQKGLSLMCSGECLIVRNDKQHWNIPLRRLEQIVLLHSVELPTRLISTCQAMGIALFYINSHQLDRSFAIIPALSLSAARQQSQLRLLEHSARIAWSRFLVQHKLSRLCSCLTLLTVKRPQKKRALTRAGATINLCRDGVQQASTLEQLRGLEGRAQKAWFAVYGQLVPSSLEFEGRNRRPPKDPVNALLSLSYTLLYLQAWQALLSHGLNPGLGFYHELASRQALACDLMEPLRIEVDLFVMALFNSKKMQGRDFYQTDKGCLLRPEAKKRFQALYDSRSISWQRLLNRYALVLGTALDKWGQQVRVGR